ncbi:hypothetical protein B0H13DRAFT_908665 [Mycena leptocephala]|nr:hypothetical protein B0H13DRAFT_908665 [Mycena leptocephala]
MSQSSGYSNLQCRWRWCSMELATAVELLDHVREHVRQTPPCFVRDIPLLVRAEEGIGESMSGIAMTTDSGSSQSVQNHSVPNPSSSLPSPPASSPTPHLQMRAIDFSLLPNTPERPVKRRKIMPPGNDSPSISLSRSNSVQPPSESPPSRALNRTPGFLTLALPSDSAQTIPNPVFPDLDTLISHTLSGVTHQPFTTPNRKPSHESAGSQSVSGSDASVERQLTQDFDNTFESVPNFDEILEANGIGDSQNLYAGELHWDDESIANLPCSRSQTPSQSLQSQFQQQQSSAALVHTSPHLSRDRPLQRRQSWYQSPRRVSNPLGVQQPSQLLFYHIRMFLHLLRPRPIIPSRPLSRHTFPVH